MSEMIHHRTSARLSQTKRFTPEVLTAIPRWMDLGASPEEIAGVLETTVSTLRWACSRAGISLRSATVYNQLGHAQWVKLRQEAALRGMPASQLFIAIVVAVAEDDLFSAVLGDYDDLGTCE